MLLASQPINHINKNPGPFSKPDGFIQLNSGRIAGQYMKKRNKRIVHYYFHYMQHQCFCKTIAPEIGMRTYSAYLHIWNRIHALTCHCSQSSVNQNSEIVSELNGAF